MTVPWTHLVAVSQLLPQSTLELEPGEAVRAALARHVGVVAIPALSATLELTHTRGGDVLVAGRLTGTLVQTCVVTLEPFEAAIDEPIAVRFSAATADQAKDLAADPEAAAGEVEIGLTEEDPPEPLIDGRIDLGALLTEFLSLAVDPYPRKPGVAWQETAGPDEPQSPFAALAGLKKSDPS